MFNETRRCRHPLLVCLLALTAMPALTASAGSEPLHAGWTETATLLPHGLIMRAKLDSGAMTTSINATHIISIEKDGEEWVKFDVTNFEGRTITIERPVVRTATIRRHFRESQDRKVIELEICIGDRSSKAEVSLIDRSGFEYQLLLGRSFMANKLLIDPARQNLLPEECEL